MIEPFGRRIYIKPEEEKTIIQSGDSNKVVRGRVIEVGDGCVKIRKDDVVIFTAWGVDEVNINGESHYFLLETDEFILARIRVPTGVASPLQFEEADPSSTGGGVREVSQTGVL